ncbi:hypothetical protein PLICRDRAFT_266350 [Plicaturopsis crispa FD-325 SS-3]|nr:hypothetical protein PLICRDRAFT_266350 [Plicaturopsis crispa FD-325 SS-3]
MASQEWPLEVWRQVLALACTDGGCTGRALSLASRYLHDASSPYKFQSIALMDTKQVLRFTAMLLNLPTDAPHHTIRVRFLYISTQKSPTKHGDEDLDLDERRSRHMESGWSSAMPMHTAEARRKFDEKALKFVKEKVLAEDFIPVGAEPILSPAVSFILNTVHLTLENLTLIWTPLSSTFSLPSSLPALAAFTLRWPGFSSPVYTGYGVPALPSLRSLHLDGDQDSVFPLLTDRAPPLTHFRISAIRRRLSHFILNRIGIRPIASQTPAFLGAPMHTAARQPTQVYRPDTSLTVGALLLQRAPFRAKPGEFPNYGAGHYNMRIVDAQLDSQLDGLAAEVPGVYLLSEAQDENDDLKEWVDWNMGGDGPWSVGDGVTTNIVTSVRATPPKRTLV